MRLRRGLRADAKGSAQSNNAYIRNLLFSRRELRITLDPFARPFAKMLSTTPELIEDEPICLRLRLRSIRYPSVYTPIFMDMRRGVALRDFDRDYRSAFN